MNFFRIYFLAAATFLTAAVLAAVFFLGVAAIFFWADTFFGVVEAEVLFIFGAFFTRGFFPTIFFFPGLTFFPGAAAATLKLPAPFLPATLLPATIFLASDSLRMPRRTRLGAVAAFTLLLARMYLSMAGRDDPVFSFIL